MLDNDNDSDSDSAHWPAKQNRDKEPTFFCDNSFDLTDAHIQHDVFADEEAPTHLWIHIDKVVLLSWVSLQVKQIAFVAVPRAIVALGAGAPAAQSVVVREGVRGLNFQAERVPARAPLVGDVLPLSGPERSLCELKVWVADPGGRKIMQRQQKTAQRPTQKTRNEGRKKNARVAVAFVGEWWVVRAAAKKRSNPSWLDVRAGVRWSIGCMAATFGEKKNNANEPTARKALHGRWRHSNPGDYRFGLWLPRGHCPGLLEPLSGDHQSLTEQQRARQAASEKAKDPKNSRSVVVRPQDVRVEVVQQLLAWVVVLRSSFSAHQVLPVVDTVQGSSADV